MMIRVSGDEGVSASGRIKIFRFFPGSFTVPGGVCIAHFDCDLFGMTLVGCRLIDHQGVRKVHPPFGRIRRTAHQGVKFSDGTLLADMLEVATRLMQQHEARR